MYVYFLALSQVFNIHKCLLYVYKERYIRTLKLKCFHIPDMKLLANHCRSLNCLHKIMKMHILQN